LFEAEPGMLAGYTVILPAVSVGNVGQLCVDVMLENLDPPPCQSLQVLHESLIPVVSTDALGSTLSTALQMYLDEKKKLVIFQLRSGILPGQGAAFISQFLQWFKNMECSELVMVAGMHAHERTDQQITGSPLRYLSTTDRTVPQDFVKLERKSRFPGLSRDGSEADELFIPGGGISRRMYLACLETGVNLTLLLKFACEGDNSGDGLMLAGQLDRLLHYSNSGHGTDPAGVAVDCRRPLKVAGSWRHLFGPPAPTQMFW